MCLCGDICCPSCGPAQGNWRCPICGEWASNVCVHMSDDGNSIKPEFEELAKQKQKEQAAADEQEDKDWYRDQKEHYETGKYNERED